MTSKFHCVAKCQKLLHNLTIGNTYTTNDCYAFDAFFIDWEHNGYFKTDIKLEHIYRHKFLIEVN